MVLIRRSVVLGAVVLAGCSESLFGAHHGGRPADDAASDSNTVPAVCPASCLADAGAEFDGTAGGMQGHWRYLDDKRSPLKTWSVMTVGNGEMIGEGNNRITSCAMHHEAACEVLPGALLVSSTGATSGSDPAIEFKAPIGKVLQLSLHAFLPAGDDQTIRLYRNSREDVLFTGTASAGTPLAHEVTVDALPGDRFLVAVAPPGNGATNVGLQLFITATGQGFPSTCQLALRFDETSSGDRVTDVLCSQATFTHLGSTGASTPLMLDPAPFSELGLSGIVPGTTYLHDVEGTKFLDYSRDVTVQLWIKLASFINIARASVLSDLGAAGAGIQLEILPGSSDMVVATTRTTTSTLVKATVSDQLLGSWHFLRVVRTATNLRVCVDGARTANLAASPVMGTAHMPDLGKDLQQSSNGATLDGSIDDLRVITGALPCQ